ncbi:MAG: ABC transporter substrate-binding protein [Zetaproteobacteria bacterium]|nr:MAG: ABC transporter substrate-binding protein [Zetaproteobacteria bacterium]
MLKKFLFSLALAIVLPAYGFAEPDTPKVVVETAVNGVIHALKSRQNKDVITLKDRESIRQAVKGYFDFREMAKRSLGKPWRKMDEAQRTDFVDTFRELLERSYGNRLSEYHDQTVEFGKVKTKGRIAIVNSEVIDAEKRTPVRYKLVHKKSGWRVYDIKVEGISMVSTFRSDFKQAVSQKGIDGFLGDLKKQVEKLKEQDKAES